MQALGLRLLRCRACTTGTGHNVDAYAVLGRPLGDRSFSGCKEVATVTVPLCE